jgi:hypothetical protein
LHVVFTFVFTGEKYLFEIHTVEESVLQEILWGCIMSDIKPSKTACKVALNILRLGTKPEMAGILPPGIVDATEKPLTASGAVAVRTIRWSRTAWMVRVYYEQMTLLQELK